MANIVRRIVSTSAAPPPGGPYSQAVIVDKTMYLSGQIGRDLSGSLVTGGVESEAKQALDNLRAVLQAGGVDTQNVVKTTVLLADINDWPAVNKIYENYFSSHPPARAAFQVGALPKGAKVEIEAVAVVGNIIDE